MHYIGVFEKNMKARLGFEPTMNAFRAIHHFSTGKIALCWKVVHANPPDEMVNFWRGLDRPDSLPHQVSLARSRRVLTTSRKLFHCHMVCRFDRELPSLGVWPEKTIGPCIWTKGDAKNKSISSALKFL